MSDSMENVAKRLGAKGSVNPLSKAMEFRLENTDRARVILTIDPVNGSARLETRARGGFCHIFELDDSDIRVLDEGVEIIGRNSEFDATLLVKSTGVINVSIVPKTK